MTTKKQRNQVRARKITAQQKILVKQRKVMESIPLKDIEDGFQALAEHITEHGWFEEPGALK
tara:strand:- start:192 stop:377 length:186 start_codon:yes stop_codon:yes gene_type:complete